MPSHRTLSLTVALEWPKSPAEGRVFTEALAAEFEALKQRRAEGPWVGVGLTIHSARLAGNHDIPRIWRRGIRFLQNARVLSQATDPWCYGLKVIETTDEPYVLIEVREEA